MYIFSTGKKKKKKDQLQSLLNSLVIGGIFIVLYVVEE